VKWKAGTKRDDDVYVKRYIFCVIKVMNE